MSAAPLASPRPPDAGNGPPPGLSVVVFSGTFAKVHYSLVMAATAAALGRPSILFFTMDALDALRSATDGHPPWRRLPASETGAIEGCTTGGALDDLFAKRGTATFEDLLLSAAEIGVRFIVCEMGLRAKELTRESLRADLPIEIAGMATLLAATPAGAPLVFV